MKRCTKCGEMKDESEFWHDAGRTDGLMPQCKPCRRAMRRNYECSHREVKKAADSRYRALHRDSVLARCLEYNRKHKERINSLNADNYKNNPIPTLARGTIYYYGVKSVRTPEAQELLRVKIMHLHLLKAIQKAKEEVDCD